MGREFRKDLWREGGQGVREKKKEEDVKRKRIERIGRG